uniref:ATP synthase subunit a n=1 Tax=Columbicola passerinae TaxID=128994 RepID=A0A6G8QRY9_9NEOP|nr:ATP synthase F0 subunit 6 [Columbicola passerinae]
MTHSLMSIFDPEAFSLPIKWSQWVFLLVILGGGFFPVGDGLKLLMKEVMSNLMILFSQGIRDPKFSLIFLVSLFVFLFFINETGMIPFVFTSSSHLVFNLSLSLPMWLGGVFLLTLKSFLSHLLPQGSPMVLSPFLVFVELISLLVRPISLGVRLMSNIMAGHMVLCLIQSMCGDLLSGQSLFSIVLSSMFLMFEVAVALVQAFVFVNLTYMYLKESEH